MIWMSVVLAAAAVTLTYLVRFRRRQGLDAAAKKEAERLGFDQAVAQHPQIDPYRCIGCGCCVTSCPEGRVLGIVNGKSTLINGLKCVGHGLCAEACPVGAITIGLGDLSKRHDIPRLTDYGETNLPGLYIAGELGGLSLIRNAINQGRSVIEHIAAEKVRKGAQGAVDAVDVIIVGAGPAGLSAALAALDNHLSHILIDHQDAGGTIRKYPKRKLVMSRPVELPLYGWLEKSEYTKEELLEIWDDIETRFPLNLKIGEKLFTVIKNGSIFSVKTDRSEYHSRQVILALGRRGMPRKLGVPGEERSKVLYSLADAADYTDEHILVVGGGDSAVEAALALSARESNTVSLSYRRDKLYRIKKRNEERIAPLIKQGKIIPYFNSEVVRIDPESVTLTTAGVETVIPNTTVFIFAGGDPPFGLLQNIGVQFGGDV